MARRPRTPSSRLAQVRVARRISQQELAEATGLSLSTIQRLEAPPTNPSLRPLVNCALALGVTLDDLIEDQWREWMIFDARRAAQPPQDGWWSALPDSLRWRRSPYREREGKGDERRGGGEP